MIATLKFSLPDEQEEFENALNGAKYSIVLYKFWEGFLRRKVNKGEHNYKTAGEALEGVSEAFWEILRSYDIYEVVK